MTIRCSPDRLVYLHARKTARALRALADRADRGEVLGVALAARTAKRETELAVVGVFEQSTEVAHYAVCKLRDVLLYPDDAG